MKLMTMIVPFLAMSAAYEDLDDNYLPKLMEDKEAFRNYIGCLVDINPCDEFGSNDKAHIPEQLSDGCDKCDEVQKQYVHAIIQTAKINYPEIYNLFEEKYDPDRTLLAKLDEKVKKYWR